MAVHRRMARRVRVIGISRSPGSSSSTECIYLTIVASGEWRRRVFHPEPRYFERAREFAYYIAIRRTPPPEDFYNGLQRLAYTFAILFGSSMVLSGLAIYKPVQLYWMTAAVRRLRRRARSAFGLPVFARAVQGDRTWLSSHSIRETIVNMMTGGKRELD